MYTQNELKRLFQDIDQRTDRALVGLRAVRNTPKVERLPGDKDFKLIASGFIVAFLAMTAVWTINGL